MVARAQPQIMPRSKKPKQIFGKRVRGYASKPFIIAGQIFARKSRQARTLTRLFTLKAATRIRAILGFKPSATAEAQRVYRKNFERRLAEAIRTAK